MRAYLTQKSNSLSESQLESVNYEMDDWSRSALKNSWCYTITNGVRGISLSRRIFHNTPAPLSNASLVAKETRRGPAEVSLFPLIFLLLWQSFASRKKRQNYGSEEIESNRFNKQKKKERKKTLNVQHTFLGRFRGRNRNDWSCQTWSGMAMRSSHCVNLKMCDQRFYHHIYKNQF